MDCDCNAHLGRRSLVLAASLLRACKCRQRLQPSRFPLRQTTGFLPTAPHYRSQTPAGNTEISQIVICTYAFICVPKYIYILFHLIRLNVTNQVWFTLILSLDVI